MLKHNKLIIYIFFASIMYSSAQAMELQESNEMKWGRRIGGAFSAALGTTVLYFSIKDHLENGTSLYNKTNLGAAAAVIIGLGSFTVKEYGIAGPVYHSENGPEEDKEVAELVMSYKTSELSSWQQIARHMRELQQAKDSNEEESTEHENNKPTIDPNSITVPLSFLYTIIQQKSHAQKANELYYNQQKPILARLPLIGAPIDGILYNPKSWNRFPSLKGDFSVLQLGAIGLWICTGTYDGIKKSLTQEKTPEDKEFEEWICKDYANIRAQQELNKIWFFMSYKVTFNKKNPRERNIHPIGNLPAELIVHIQSYLNPNTFVDKETNIVHISIPKNQLIQYVLPYMGPIIKIQKEDTGNEYGVCTHSKVSPTRMSIRYDNCESLEAFLNEHYQATVARRYGVL